MGCVCESNKKENDQILNKGGFEQYDQPNQYNLQNENPAIQRGYETKLKQSFKKELCKSIANSLPSRTSTTLSNLKNIMKSKTDRLSQVEKAFVIFIWISQNIDYDANSFFAGRSVDCTPEGVFASGKSVCSGYSRLYQDIALFLGLEVECVSCYAKGVGYQPGDKIDSTNHEYNVIKLDGKWYPIDATWGAGHIEGKDYIRQFTEFYFLSDPNLLIKTHFPEDDRWQLGDRKYTFEEFLAWPQVKEKFNIYGFYKYYPEQGLIKLNGSNSLKFYLYAKDMNKVDVSCEVYLLQNNCFHQQLNLSLINKYEDKFEITCLLNRKGKYKIQLFGNDDGSTHFSDIMEYTVEVNQDARNELKFPKLYGGASKVNIIQPLYDNLKHGQITKFKLKSSSFDQIIIADGEWHHLDKNPQGIFEKDIIIQSSPGNSVIIGYPTQSNSMSYLAAYQVN